MKHSKVDNSRLKLCESCSHRDCKKLPVRGRGVLGGTWICQEYEKDEKGMKLNEVTKTKRSRRGDMVLFTVGSGGRR